jgi:outer membrane protein assembly factor BamB
MRLPLTLCLSLCVSSIFAGEWPSWRGPHGNGVAEGASFPTQWSATENVKWKTPLPGSAGSTPVVTGSLIALTCAERDAQDQNGKNKVWGLNRTTGEILWKTEVGNEKPGKHKKGSGCNPSPVTDGQHIFVYFKSGDFAALDLKGQIVWHKNLQKEYGEDTLWWDLGSSPVLTEKHVVITVMQSLPSPSYLAAFNKETGEVVWKVARELGAPEEAAQSYSTPVVTHHDGQEILVTVGADFVTAHAAADGKELWRVGSLNPEKNKYFRSIASAAVADGMVVAPYSRGEMLYGIKLGGSGDVTKSHVVWQKKGISSDVPTPIATAGKAYVLTDKGVLACLNPATGDVVWESQLQKTRHAYSASPILAGGNLYAIREDGTTFVAAAGSEFKQVGMNSLGDDVTVVATPLFVDGQILIRTFEGLFCIGQ